MGWVRGLMAAYCIILLQVMGYVAAFRKDEENIPVALVITETSVDILFFPFVHKSGERLLTTAHLPLNLWKSGNQIELNCLVLLAYLSDLRDNTIVLQTAKDHEKMRKIMKISTDTASDKEQIEQMEHKLQQVEREREQVEREKEQEKELRQQAEQRLEAQKASRKAKKQRARARKREASSTS